MEVNVHATLYLMSGACLPMLAKVVSMRSSMETSNFNESREDRHKHVEGDESTLLALRFLLREPPIDHDFENCPICKKYGMGNI